MVFGKEVVIYPKTKDKYGRTVGHVVVGKKDVNLAMLEQGMAWHYVKYVSAHHRHPLAASVAPERAHE